MVTRGTARLLILLRLLQVIAASPDPNDAAVDECCTFDAMQSGCNNTFTKEDGDALACTLTKQTKLPGESCVIGRNGQLVPHSAEEYEGDRGSSSPQIELLAAAIIDDVYCSEGNATRDQPDSICMDLYRKKFIAIKITFQFKITTNITGVLFDLSDTSPNCHYLHIPDIKTEELLINRTFSYTGFVGLHPGSRYLLRAKPVIAGLSRGEHSELSFSIPDCSISKSWSEDYYCNLPSPAHWVPLFIIQPNTLDVTFTIWEELSTFSSYNLYLFLGSNVEDVHIELVTFHTSELDKVTTVTIVGKNYKAMRHKFIVDYPGVYTVAVLPRPDDACEKDPHWGKSLCRYGKRTVRLTIPAPQSPQSWPELLPPLDQILTPSPDDPLSSTVLTASSSVIPSLPTPSQQLQTPSMTPSSEPLSDLNSLLLGITISLVLFVVLLVISIICCYRDRTISKFMLQNCKGVLCNKDSSQQRPSDLMTVTSSCVLHQYQPVPLEGGPRDLLPSTLDDFILLSTTSPSTCSEPTASDSASQASPPTARCGKPS